MILELCLKKMIFGRSGLKFKALRSLNVLSVCRIFSKTGTWPVTCTFDMECVTRYVKEVEEHWKPVLEQLDEEPILNSSRDGTASERPKVYALSMFPYPSGTLHLGHVRIYTSSDIVSRYNRLRGRSVVHPMGWDSFGLPAENAAIANKTSPREWTYSNIKSMKEQLKSLGLIVDWREATSDPSFYKWTQWLIIQLLRNNLLYQAMSKVNWDPVDCTVIADAQVDENGLCWRSGAKVEKRLLKQWFIKTAAFVQDIYESRELNRGTTGVHLDQILAIQQAWIGELTGRVFYLDLQGGEVLPVFTERPDLWLESDTELALAKDHWLVNSSETNLTIVNPFTKKPIRVTFPDDVEIPTNFNATLVNKCHRSYEGVDDQKVRLVLEECSKSARLGGYKTSKTFSDWLISRQRYWGAPIPIVHCPDCGVQPINESELPLELPQVNDITAKNTNADGVRSKLEELAPSSWLTANCPNCARSDCRRETDTLDTFVDSSWYFLRYGSQQSDVTPFDTDFRPVSVYFGGAEHAQGHLLYSRFIYKFLRKFKYIKNDSCEPFERMVLQGLVNGLSHKHNGQYVTAEEAATLPEKEVTVSWEKMSKSKGNGVNPLDLIKKYGVDATRFSVLGTGTPTAIRFWKEDEFKEFMIFFRKLILTVDQFIFVRELENEDPLAPVIKRFTVRPVKNKETFEKELEHLTQLRNSTIQGVTLNYEATYRVGLSSKMLQTCLEQLRKFALTKEIALSREYEECLGDMIVMMTPLCPHLSHELWAGFAKYASQVSSRYNLANMVHEQLWPKMDESFKIPIVLAIDQERSVKIEVPQDVIERANVAEITDIVTRHVQSHCEQLSIDLEKWSIVKVRAYSDLYVNVQVKSGQRPKKKKKKIKVDSDEEDEVADVKKLNQKGVN